MKQLDVTQIETPLAKIKTGPYQQRQVFDVTELRGLARTIKADGLITPPTVMAVNGHYELIMGDRRRRALWALALEAGGMDLDEAVTLVCSPTVDELPARFEALHRVTARVNLSRETDPKALRTLATIENLQRVDLSPLEKAQGFQSLLDSGMSREEIVERVGEGWSQVKKYLTLLSLPVQVQSYFDGKTLPMGVAKEMSELPADVMIEVAGKMAGRKIKEIEAVVKRVKANLPEGRAKKAAPVRSQDEVEELAAVEVEPPTAQKTVKEQLAEAREIIAKLTMQIHLDGRLLGQCAEVIAECQPESKVGVMARARARQIETAIKGRQVKPSLEQQKRNLKVETFIEKRARGGK